LAGSGQSCCISNILELILRHLCIPDVDREADAEVDDPEHQDQQQRQDQGELDE